MGGGEGGENLGLFVRVGSRGRLTLSPKHCAKRQPDCSASNTVGVVAISLTHYEIEREKKRQV